MCQSKIKPTSRLIAATVAGAALSAMLGGCSDLYTDRRDQISLSAGDAIAANNAMQTNDPWPAHSGNTNIAFNGQRMQTAVERYRTNTPWLPATPVINPSQPTTSTTPPTQQTLSVPPGGYSTTSVPGIAAGTTTSSTTVVSEPNGSTSTTQATTSQNH
jgi:hypothetical protein